MPEDCGVTARTIGLGLVIVAGIALVLASGLLAAVGWASMQDQCPYGNDCEDSRTAFKIGMGVALFAVVTTVLAVTALVKRRGVRSSA
jgi:hypothetical protein